MVVCCVKIIKTIFKIISYFTEQLVLSAFKEVKNSWEKDYDVVITPLVEENQPCYILYR